VIFHDPAMRKCVQGMFWRFITDLGDTTVMAPTAIAIAIWLFWRRGSRESLIWLFSIGAGGVLAVLTKIAFLGWGIGVPALDFTAISGHSMMATAVLTVCGYFFGAAFSRTHAIVGFAIGFGLGLLVAFSRVQIGAHSSSEAIAGAAVGLLIALGSTRVNLDDQTRARPLRPPGSVHALGWTSGEFGLTSDPGAWSSPRDRSRPTRLDSPRDLPN
jgi:membrane-associated phospholipid phosphatase